MNSRSGNVQESYIRPLFLFIFLIFLIFLWHYQTIEDGSDWFGVVTEVFGSFIVTFFGVYFSIRLTERQQHDQKIKEENEVILATLKLISAELALNKKALDNLLHGLIELPNDPQNLYDNFAFLCGYIPMAVKTQQFYGSVSNGSLLKISKSHDILNSLELAYYNLELTTSGLTISVEALKGSKGPLKFDLEIAKVLKTRDFVLIAENTISELLRKEGIVIKGGFGSI